MGIKIGNISVYSQGRFIKPVMLSKLIQSFVLLAIPTILSIIGIILGTKFVKLNIILPIILAILLIYTLTSLTFAGIIDPGIMPGRELQEYYLDQLWNIITNKQKLLYQQKQTKQQLPFGQNKLQLSKPMSSKNISPIQNVQLYIEQDPRNQFKKSRCYNILDSNHKAETPLSYNVKGFKFNAKFCPTCRFYRPLRSSHSSKTNACIQRYDHFCIWLGTDVALHNHWLFYLMMLGVLVTMSVSVLFNVGGIISPILAMTICKNKTDGTCSAYANTSLGQEIAGLILCLICGPVSAYIVYSIMDLIKYHYSLCKTASLTKEDNGGNNYNTSTPFSKMNTFKNFCLAFEGRKQERVLHKFIVEQEKLLKLAKQNQFVISFDSLGRMLKMNNIYGFDNLIPQLQQNTQQSSAKQSMRFSVMCLDENDENIQQQQIASNIKFTDVITARDAFEFCILRAQNMVQMTFDDFIRLKKEKPELFVESENVGSGPKGNDTALMRCAARLSGKGKKSDEQKQSSPKPTQPQFQAQSNRQIQMQPTTINTQKLNVKDKNSQQKLNIQSVRRQTMI